NFQENPEASPIPSIVRKSNLTQDNNDSLKMTYSDHQVMQLNHINCLECKNDNIKCKLNGDVVECKDVSSHSSHVNNDREDVISNKEDVISNREDAISDRKDAISDRKDAISDRKDVINKNILNSSLSIFD